MIQNKKIYYQHFLTKFFRNLVFVSFDISVILCYNKNRDFLKKFLMYYFADAGYTIIVPE